MITPISSLQNIRNEYTKAGLNERDVHADPVEQFTIWFNEALSSKVIEPNAMTLATVDAQNRPSVRVVLLKNVDERGFTFYTNYDSHKGKDIAYNKHVSILFFWPELERQVRIEGVASKLSFEESELYFHSRPFASQIGAISSPQSEIIESRDVLDKKNKELEKKYEDASVPMPNYWGGYLIVPKLIEFWQGGAGRLHDRLVFTKEEDEKNNWKISRLAP